MVSFHSFLRAVSTRNANLFDSCHWILSGDMIPSGEQGELGTPEPADSEPGDVEPGDVDMGDFDLGHFDFGDFDFGDFDFGDFDFGD